MKGKRHLIIEKSKNENDFILWCYRESKNGFNWTQKFRGKRKECVMKKLELISEKI